MIELTVFIKFYSPAPNPCEAQGMDLAFAIDRTRSVGVDNYKLVKGFLLQLTDALTIGPEETHTGLIVFAKQAHVISTFADGGFYDKENLYHLIYNLSGEKGSFGLRLFIDRALKKANEELFTDRGGDRPEFPNVLILLSAGKTNPESKSFSATIPLLQVGMTEICFPLTYLSDFLCLFYSHTNDLFHLLHCFIHCFATNPFHVGDNNESISS